MKNLYKSLAAFQYECPIIHKGTSGYGYTYADLSEIMQVITPLLQKHGLGFTQVINENSLQTILFHVETGESITSSIAINNTTNLKGMNEFQTLGSCITYLRRYSLSAILGIVTDKDTDANIQKTEPVKVDLTPLRKEFSELFSHPALSNFQDTYKKIPTMDETSLKKGIAWAKKLIQDNQ